MKYRIKIEIDNLGRRKFIPQAKDKWFIWWWYGIIESSFTPGLLLLSSGKRMEFEAVFGADKIIKDFMKQEEIKKSKKVNNLKYINYD